MVHSSLTALMSAIVSIDEQFYKIDLEKEVKFEPIVNEIIFSFKQGQPQMLMQLLEIHEFREGQSEWQQDLFDKVTVPLAQALVSDLVSAETLKLIAFSQVSKINGA